MLLRTFIPRAPCSNGWWPRRRKLNKPPAPTGSGAHPSGASSRPSSSWTPAPKARQSWTHVEKRSKWMSCLVFRQGVRSYRELVAIEPAERAAGGRQRGGVVHPPQTATAAPAVTRQRPPLTKHVRSAAAHPRHVPRAGRAPQRALLFGPAGGCCRVDAIRRRGCCSRNQSMAAAVRMGQPHYALSFVARRRLCHLPGADH